MANENYLGGLLINVILFVIFLILKLMEYIDWSWWWITSPLWITAILFIVIVTFFYIKNK
jgi:hypothetical protein